MNLSRDDWAYVDERAEHFTGREWVFERIRAFLASDARMLVIVAPPGTGKTAIAARLVKASAGRLEDEPALPIPPGTIDAAVFCQAGRVSLLGVAQDLGDQLAETLPGFAEEQRRAVATDVTVTGVDIETGDVAPGASVAGVKIDLARLGPDHAFADGLALPIRRLAERRSRAAIVLVDSLDEAYESSVAQRLPRELSSLSGARLILTTRDDPRVLAELGDLNGAVAIGRAVVMDLIDDAPADVDDVRDYVDGRLRGRGPDGAVTVLARRIAEEAKGNFLYAYFVVGGVLGSTELAGLDALAASRLPLPAGGLEGVYDEFLRRVVGPDRSRWRMAVRPIVAPIAVALGSGLDTTQLVAIAGKLAGRTLSRSAVGDVTEDLGQFLQGPRPHGPFLVYHRSFAEFLLDADANLNWPVGEVETHSAIVDVFTPGGSAAAAAWNGLDSYARAHLAAHAAACGRLDQLLGELGFVLGADVDRLLPFLNDAIAPDAIAIASIIKLASADLRRAPERERASYLELVARMQGADRIADRIGAFAPDRAWRVPRARWRRSASHIRAQGHRGAVGALAIWELAGRPIIFSGGGDDSTVRMWDLATLAAVSDPLLTDLHGVTSLAIGELSRLPVLVAGGMSGIRSWDLPTLAPRYTPYLPDHEGKVTSMAVIELDSGPALVSAGEDGSIRVSDLATFAPLGMPLRGHLGAVVAIATMRRGGACFVVSGGEDGAVLLWDLAGSTPVMLGLPGSGPVESISIAEVGDRPIIVAGDTNEGLRTWDFESRESRTPLMPLPLHPAYWGSPERWSGPNATVTAKVGDRTLMVSGGYDTISVWDLSMWDPRTPTDDTDREPLGGHDAGITAVAIGRVEGRPAIASGDEYGILRVFRVDEGVVSDEPRAQGPGRGELVGSFWDWGIDPIIFSVAAGELEGRAVVVSAGAEDITIWDFESLAPLGEPFGAANGIRAIAVGTLGGRSVVVCLDLGGTLRAYELNGTVVKGRRASVVGSIAVSELDGQLVVIGEESGGKIRMWALPGFHPYRKPLHPSGMWGYWKYAKSGQPARFVGVIATGVIDGRPVIAGEDRDEIRVWDLETMAPVGEALVGREGSTRFVSGIANWPVTGVIDGEPMIARGGKDVAANFPPVMREHWDREVYDALFGRDGFTRFITLGHLDDRPVLVAGGNDGMVRIWSLRTWRQLAAISIPNAKSAAVISPDSVVVSALSGLLVIEIGRGAFG